MQKQYNWLQIKVFIGLGLLLFGTAAIIAYLNLLAQDNHTKQELLSHVRQLDVRGEVIKRRANTYANHAPRDFAPYERDLIIFYPDFMKELMAFDFQVDHIAKLQRELPTGLLHGTNEELKISIQNLKSNWTIFKQGFQEKIGIKPNEPRLEWGADYVQENQELINNITGMLIVTIDEVIQKKLEANKKLNYIAMSGAGILLILGVIWFYLKVVRRITLTVIGCQRVAQGDFGYQLSIKGNDELSTLATAFNNLSARTHFVLTMLTNMHRHGSAESKVDALWNEASSYLPIQWLGLLELDKANNSLKITSMRSNKPMNKAVQQSLLTIIKDDQHLLDVSQQGSPIKYENLSKSATEIPTAKFMREIQKLGLLNSQLIVPLISDDGWQGLLIFVASDSSAYSNEHLELMGNLAPYIANGFSQKI